MNYSEFAELYKGKAIHSRKTGKEIAKIGFYWKYEHLPNTFFEEVLYDFHQEFTCNDKFGWFKGKPLSIDHYRKMNAIGLKKY